MIEVLPPDHPKQGRLETFLWDAARWFSKRRDRKWLQMHDADLRKWNRSAEEPGRMPPRLTRCPKCGMRGVPNPCFCGEVIT